MQRRSFLAGILAAGAAPALAKAGVLMPVKKLLVPPTIYTLGDSLIGVGTRFEFYAGRGETIIGHTHSGMPGERVRLERRLAPGCGCVLIKVSPDQWVISGTGIS